MAELARTQFRGLAEPAAWLGPDEVTLAELARKYFRGLAEPAAWLGPDFAVPTPTRWRNGGIPPNKRFYISELEPTSATCNFIE